MKVGGGCDEAAKGGNGCDGSAKVGVGCDEVVIVGGVSDEALKVGNGCDEAAKVDGGGCDEVAEVDGRGSSAFLSGISALYTYNIVVEREQRIKRNRVITKNLALLDDTMNTMMKTQSHY